MTNLRSCHSYKMFENHIVIPKYTVLPRKYALGSWYIVFCFALVPPDFTLSFKATSLFLSHCVDTEDYEQINRPNLVDLIGWPSHTKAKHTRMYILCDIFSVSNTWPRRLSLLPEQMLYHCTSHTITRISLYHEQDRCNDIPRTATNWCLDK